MEEIGLKIITTDQISNQFSRKSPYISNTFSRESLIFQTCFSVNKWSSRHSKDLSGKLIDLKIQMVLVWSLPWVATYLYKKRRIDIIKAHVKIFIIAGCRNDGFENMVGQFLLTFCRTSTLQKETFVTDWHEKKRIDIHEKGYICQQDAKIMDLRNKVGEFLLTYMLYQCMQRDLSWRPTGKETYSHTKRETYTNRNNRREGPTWNETCRYTWKYFYNSRMQKRWIWKFRWESLWWHTCRTSTWKETYYEDPHEKRPIDTQKRVKWQQYAEIKDLRNQVWESLLTYIVVPVHEKRPKNETYMKRDLSAYVKRDLYL